MGSPHKIGHQLRLSPERRIEILWKNTRNAIYGSEILSKEEEARIAREMQCVNLVYALVKELFEGKNRNSGERYFEHLRETANIIIEREISDSVTLYEVILALLHDAFEDTHITSDALEQIFSRRIEGKRGRDFGKRLVESLKKLSKKDWKEYILSPLDREFVTSFESKVQYSVGDDSDKENEEIGEDLFGNEQKTNQEHQRYNKIKKEAKEQRDEEYYSTLGNLSTSELKVKLADRLHNLRTQWDPNDKNQVAKKIRETKRFFLPLARKNFPRAYYYLSEEIKKLEEKLGFAVEIDAVIEKCRKDTDSVFFDQ